LWEWELLSRECRDAGTDGGVLAKELRATLAVINKKVNWFENLRILIYGKIVLVGFPTFPCRCFK